MHRIEKEIVEIKEYIQQQKVIFKEILTLTEAAIYLDVSTSYLYKLTSQRKITHYKPGSKLIFFKKKELDDWIIKGEVSSIEKLSNMGNKGLKLVKIL